VFAENRHELALSMGNASIRMILISTVLDHLRPVMPAREPQAVDAAIVIVIELL
jgi:hypothetical protein